MTAGNNRKENTFKKKQVEPEIEKPLPVIVEDTNVKKDKKEKTSKEKKTSKESKPQKEKKEAGRLQKIIGILFLCLAVFLGIALISYLVSFFSGHHQEYGYQIFSQKEPYRKLRRFLGTNAPQRVVRHRVVLLRLSFDNHRITPF